MQADRIIEGMQAELHTWDGKYDTVKVVEIIMVFSTGRVLIKDLEKNIGGVVPSDRLRSVGDHCPLPSERKAARRPCRECLMEYAAGELRNGKCPGCAADKLNIVGRGEMFSVNNRRNRKSAARAA